MNGKGVGNIDRDSEEERQKPERTVEGGGVERRKSMRKKGLEELKERRGEERDKRVGCPTRSTARFTWVGCPLCPNSAHCACI